MKNTQVNNQQKKACSINLKDFLYQWKQSIEVNDKLQTTRTLAKTLLEPTGEENLYVQFVYVQQKICNHTQGQVLVSMNTDPINTNKQINNQLH